MKKTNMIQTGDPLYYHYKGPLSRKFWERINATDEGKYHLYGLGVTLQRLEEYVIDRLLDAEK